METNGHMILGRVPSHFTNRIYYLVWEKITYLKFQIIKPLVSKKLEFFYKLIQLKVEIRLLSNKLLNLRVQIYKMKFFQIIIEWKGQNVLSKQDYMQNKVNIKQVNKFLRILIKKLNCKILMILIYKLYKQILKWLAIFVILGIIYNYCR